jgi:hypothetical protein
MLHALQRSNNIFSWRDLCQSVLNRIGGVMVSVLASSAVDLGLSPVRVEPKNIKLVFVASLQCMQH